MELNEKLAKWAGFSVMSWQTYPNRPHRIIKMPDGEVGSWELIDFRNDLNACFKWLVPELLKRNFYIGIGAEKSGWECWIFEGEPIEGDPFQEYEVKVLADTPALAICKAIEQLIKEVSCQKE